MKQNILVVLAVLALGSCSQHDEPVPPADGRQEMTFEVVYPGASRATDAGFEVGDRIGLFVSDATKPLEIAGNTVNNEALTSTAQGWQPARKIYWDDAVYNAYAYYPYAADVPSIEDFPFAVDLDQSRPASADTLSGYEASDLLFASSKGIQASAEPVSLRFRHLLSKVTIRLVKGEDFEGEIPDSAEVLIHNTVPKATVDLNVGIATKHPRAAAASITASQVSADTYTAIVVPQRLVNRVPLVEINMNGVSFLYESKFVFKPGVHHLVNLVIDKNPEQLKIEIGGEIVGWN